MKERSLSILKSLILPAVLSICLFTPSGNNTVVNVKVGLCIVIFLIHLFVKKSNRYPILSFVCFTTAAFTVYVLALFFKQKWMYSGFISNKMGLLLVITVIVCMDFFFTIYRVIRSRKRKVQGAAGVVHESEPKVFSKENSLESAIFLNNDKHSTKTL